MYQTKWLLRYVIQYNYLYQNNIKYDLHNSLVHYEEALDGEFTEFTLLVLPVTQ